MLANPEQAKLLRPKSDYTEAMFKLCDALHLKAPVAEYKFCPDRKWRFDFAWPNVRVAVEIDGGILSGGRHTTSISGRLRDIEKLNTAAVLGWLVLTATTLPKQMFDKRKKPMPWLSLEDPKFRLMLLRVFCERNILCEQEF